MPLETSTHQDHVIAHVIDTTVLGYFVFDEAIHLLLNIGFIWTIYLDGQMVLMPRSAAIRELQLSDEEKRRISDDTDVLDRGGAETLRVFSKTATEVVIEDAKFLGCDELRRLLLIGETASLIIETSLASGEIKVTVESAQENLNN